jgi:hypothetical protein
MTLSVNKIIASYDFVTVNSELEIIGMEMVVAYLPGVSEEYNETSQCSRYYGWDI